MPRLVKILAIGAAAIAVAAGGVLAYAATLPDEFQVSRSTSINAPPEKIFPMINDLRRFNEWNPFAKQDPTIKLVYSGPQSGAGAANDWDSEGSAGKGRLTIVDAAAPSKIIMQLDMMKPIEGHNVVVFALQPNNSATDVSWTMSGKFPFIGKLISVFSSMDGMVGGEFEKGLADLKQLAESQNSI